MPFFYIKKKNNDLDILCFMNETVFARYIPWKLPFMYPSILRIQELKIVDKFNKQTNENIGTFMTRSLKQ